MYRYITIPTSFWTEEFYVVSSARRLSTKDPEQLC